MCSAVRIRREKRLSQSASSHIGSTSMVVLDETDNPNGSEKLGLVMSRIVDEADHDAVEVTIVPQRLRDASAV